ncbi:MAG: tRNA cyclic N6-threonylcarbamoyladenosine(37) synthase TcdA [Halobacteriovoraceae bacterium]|nr:tRNA cyclic N6-threonylcarbamoyladenosine(37) synthase TcdA [Halobacteriovoraceae bacterium]
MKSMSETYLQRFSGIARLYGDAALTSFFNSHIAVVGVGGVGSWTAESLCRSGIGKLTLIDMDEVCVTNTNRQLHALSDSIGKTKVAVLKDRLQKINPECVINIYEDFLTAETIEDFLNKNYTVVIDAIDSLKNKTLMADYCRTHKIPLVTVGGAGGKKDPTLVRCGDLSESTRDNLLKRLKKKLRVDFSFPREGKMDIQAIYSIENAMYPDEKGGVCFKKDLKDKTQAKLDCATGMGTASFATGAFGFAAAKAALDVALVKS